MPTHDACVIVGASLAGAKAAQTLRDEGFDGQLVLVGEERERPTRPFAFRCAVGHIQAGGVRFSGTKRCRPLDRRQGRNSALDVTIEGRAKCL